MKIFITMLAVLFFFVGGVAYAGTTDVVFEWDTNDEEDLAGYNVYQKSDSGESWLVDDGSGKMIPDPDKKIATVLLTDTGFDHTGDRCEFRLNGVIDGVHQWVLTAIDTEVPVNESPISNEVSADLDSTAPGAPDTVVIKLTVKVEVTTP